MEGVNQKKYKFKIDHYGDEHREKILKYIESLEEIECNAMKIAEEHLQTSFHIMKSIGYKKWISQKKG